MPFSLVYMVKNEIFNLPKSISVMKEFNPDEVVIVDTGSKDGTYEWAKSQFPNTTFRFKWKHDFGEGKTFALKKCTKPWILILDADEFIHPTWEPILKKFISTSIIEDGYKLRFLNFLQSPFWLKDAKFVKGIGVRLFKNKSGIRYEGCIHEKLIGVNTVKAGEPIIVHLQYKSNENLIEKMEYYRSLMDKKIKKEGWNYINYMHYGDIHRKLYQVYNTEYDFMRTIHYFKMASIAKPDDKFIINRIAEMEVLRARRKEKHQEKNNHQSKIITA